jgi:vacuolar-type H+-ATPase subunit E/Vma4
MGRAALVESLRARAAEDVQALWRDVRASAEAYRAELSGELVKQQDRDASAAAMAAARLEEDALVEARHRAREVRAQAALEVAGRLHDLALAELPRLRREGGAALFGALAGELPRCEWSRVTVNPADRELARTRFPQAEVRCDERICGGLEAEADSGRIRVSNTLETRLATAWPDILAGLVAGLLPASDSHGTAA